MALFRQATVDDGEERPSLFSRIVHYICYALILALYLFFFWRMCSRGDTELAKSYCWTEAARAAYADNAGTFLVRAQEPKSEIAETTTKSKNNFAFAISSIYYTPCINQLQFTLRYNDSMMESLQAEYGLASAPEGEAFVYVLADNLGTVYTEYQYLTDERNVNNYRRLVFEGMSFDADVTEFFVSIYYIGDAEIAKPLLTLSVWEVGRQVEPVDFGEPARTALYDRPAYTVKSEDE